MNDYNQMTQYSGRGKALSEHEADFEHFNGTAGDPSQYREKGQPVGGVVGSHSAGNLGYRKRFIIPGNVGGRVPGVPDGTGPWWLNRVGDSASTATVLNTAATVDPTGIVGKVATVYGWATSLFGGNKADADRKKKVSDFLYPGGVAETFDAYLNSIAQQPYMAGAIARAGVPKDNMAAAIAYWKAQYANIKDTSKSDTERSAWIDFVIEGKSGNTKAAYSTPSSDGFDGKGVMSWVNYALPIVIAEYIRQNPYSSYVLPPTPATVKPGTVKVNPVISQGSRGGAVAQMQVILGITADGMFGPQTAEAVKTFQRSHGLTADGIVGPQTWAELSKMIPTRGVEVPGGDSTTVDADGKEYPPGGGSAGGSSGSGMNTGTIIGLAFGAAAIAGAAIAMFKRKKVQHA